MVASGEPTTASVRPVRAHHRDRRHVRRCRAPPAPAARFRSRAIARVRSLARRSRASARTRSSSTSARSRDACTFRGRTWAGVVTVSYAVEGESTIVKHAYDGVTDGRAEIDGTAVVTRTQEQRHVVTEFVFDGPRGHFTEQQRFRVHRPLADDAGVKHSDRHERLATSSAGTSTSTSTASKCGGATRCRRTAASSSSAPTGAK